MPGASSSWRRSARIFARPLHPYTRGLLQCLPHPSRFGQPLFSIEGAPPDLRRPPAGCRFAPRCPHAIASCRDATSPPLVRARAGAPRGLPGGGAVMAGPLLEVDGLEKRFDVGGALARRRQRA